MEEISISDFLLDGTSRQCFDFYSLNFYIRVNKGRYLPQKKFSKVSRCFLFIKIWQNMTWPLAEALRPSVINMVYQKNNTTVFTSAGFIGYIGVFTGVKDRDKNLNQIFYSFTDNLFNAEIFLLRF